MNHAHAAALVRMACEQGDYDRATTLVLEHHGQELLLFIVSRLGSRTDAEEAFAALATRVWRGLPSFAWRSHLRTWLFTLARNAALDHARSKRRQKRLHEVMDPRLVTVIDRVRTETAPHLRTAIKDRVRALRARLDPDDRSLLALRVDRAMDWKDIACILRGDAAAELDAPTLGREAARLRKRFERIKVELRRMAEQEGLLDSY